MKSKFAATPIRAILLLIVLSIFSGCLSYENRQPFDSSASQQIVVTSIPTPSVALQRTHLPPTATIINVPLTINQPTSTRANTAQPGSQKPLPTRNPSEAKVTALRLLRSNGDCKLPCIWSIEPGSSVKTLDKLFRYFPGETQSSQNIWLFPLKAEDKQGIRLLYSTGNHTYDIIFIAQFSAKAVVEQLTLKIITNEDSQTPPAQAQPSLNTLYTLPQILHHYGQPSEILIAPFPQAWDSMEDWRPFFVLFVYEDEHFMVLYQTLKESIGRDFRGCFSSSQVFLTSWQPESVPSWQAALDKLATNEVNPVTIKYFKPLDEVSDWTIEDFYTSFKDTSQPVCINTARAFWPNIDPYK